MRRLLEAYQYAAPAVLTPLAAWLWLRHYEGQAGLAALALLVPILHAYIVPGVGTNLLGVWEFDTRLRLARFRPHHGFVFGSATAMLVLGTLALGPGSNASIGDLARRGLATAAVLGVANWIYDVVAIRAGVLKVYNQSWANGRGPGAIVSDYAPWFFGGFGLVFGAGLGLAERLLAADGSTLRVVEASACLLAATITLPTLGYVIQSYARHGHHGCLPVPRAVASADMSARPRRVSWLEPAAIERLASDPAQRMRLLSTETIDCSRPFVPESYTQLYYTPLYQGLHREHRLRYNQLFGIRINEYIMMLEVDLVERLLSPLRRHPNVARDPTLVRCLETMIEEEKHHYQCFLKLNRLCRPDLFRERERFFSDLPWITRAMFGTVGFLAGRLSFALWYLMAMEESSAALARDMAHNPVTENLGPLEPTFAAVHREHMRDEARHLQIDGLLVDLCLGDSGPAKRALNARLFKSLLAPVTRPTRAGSGVKVIRQLVREMPELSWHEEDLIRAVLALEHDRAFQTSLFNRADLPLTFGVFDRTDELQDLGTAMVGYDRR